MRFSHDLATKKLEALKNASPFLSSTARFGTFDRIRFLSKNELSSAGWYFHDTHTSSYSVKCPFCLVEVVLKPTDDPWMEHKNLSPDCEFVRLGKLDEETWTPFETINLALRCATLKKYADLWNVIETLEEDKHFKENSEETTRKLINIRSASKYLTFEKRLQSFDSYPYDKINGPKCTSKKLARAGWYSTTSDDSPTSAKCPFCLLELEFDPSDDPWMEHKTRKPDCYFVKLGKLEERHWSTSEALLLAVRCATMKEHEIVMWLVEEMENDENWSELKESMKFLISKSRRIRRTL